jgi:hypothetical protein
VNLQCMEACNKHKECCAQRLAMAEGV